MEVCNIVPVSEALYSIREIHSTSLREEAARLIRTAILFGEMLPGPVYSVPQLAKRLGVSATPVREAVLDLVNAGMVESVRNRGFRVVPTTHLDMREILELRLLIEPPLISRLAGELSAAHIRELRSLVSEGTAIAAEGDLSGWASLDTRFHETLLLLAGNGRATKFILELRNQMRLSGSRARADAEALRVYAEEHERILEALERGDKPAASDELAAHLDWVRLEGGQDS